MSEQWAGDRPYIPYVSYILPHEGYYGDINTFKSQFPETKSLKVKKLNEEAKLPSKSRNTDEGYDLYCLEDFDIAAGETVKVKTGIALGIPEGYWAKIEGRSGLASKGITVYGGVIDNEYIGEIIVCLHNSNHWKGEKFTKGSKIAQFVLHKHRHLDIIEVEQLETTDRGASGFGSSGQ